MFKLSEHDKAVLNCVFNPNLPLNEAFEEELSEELIDVEEETEEVVRTKRMEIEAVSKTENSDPKSALEILSSAIAIASNRPSLYNNRAQVHRFLGNIEEAANDLTKAIERAGNCRRTLCQALCQRGTIYIRNGENEKAAEDFNEAAKLGSQFAKNQLIQLNPYAALCNQMLKQVFEELKNDQESIGHN